MNCLLSDGENALVFFASRAEPSSQMPENLCLLRVELLRGEDALEASLLDYADARALALIASNSSWVIAPLSSRPLARSISAVGPLELATDRMYSFVCAWAVCISAARRLA